MKLKMPRIVETLRNVGFLKIPNLAQMKTFAKFTLFQIFSALQKYTIDLYTALLLIDLVHTK